MREPSTFISGKFRSSPDPFYGKTVLFQERHDLIPVIPLDDDGVVLETTSNTQIGFQVLGQFFEIAFGPVIAFQNGNGLALSLFIFADNGVVLQPIGWGIIVFFGLLFGLVVGKQIFELVV